MTLVLTLASLAVSTLALVLLARRDPKRLRTTGQGDGSAPAPARRGLVVLALLPGMVLALLGQGAATLLWLGAAPMLGWLIANAGTPSLDRSAPDEGRRRFG